MPQDSRETSSTPHAVGGSVAAVHVHPTWATYKWVALNLTAITAVEVWVYYVPTFAASRLFAPILLLMSAVKFAIVVLFYMHLRYDARVLRMLFAGPLFIASVTALALLLLFSKLVILIG
jgi:cytochrome c oxidase subunit 4